MTAIESSPQLKADVLVEALPYIRRFAGKTVVVKYGGNALAGASEGGISATSSTIADQNSTFVYE